MAGLVLREASHARSLRFAFRTAQNPAADKATPLPYLFAASSPFDHYQRKDGDFPILSLVPVARHKAKKPLIFLTFFVRGVQPVCNECSQAIL